MKATFFSRLTYLDIDGSLGRGIQFVDKFFITNDKNYIRSIVDSRSVEQIGTLEYNFLMEGPIAYFKIDELDESAFWQTSVNLLNVLSNFENSLWLSQDSCVGHEVGFICNDRRVTSVRHGGHLTLASGLTEPLHCSAAAFSEIVRQIRPGIQKIDFSKTYKTHNTKSVSRSWLALHLIGYAQQTVFIPNKIAFYCSAIEALLSTSQAELSHQIAERVSVLTKDNGSRIETYRFMKKCYGLRSKYIHGATVSLTKSDKSPSA